jgi:nucleoside-diphosphate-sugar epimerase
MRVLITGAGGFIGRHLVEDQLARGREVTALDINSGYLSKLRMVSRIPVDTQNSSPGNGSIKIVERDFADFGSRDSELGKYDICFHLASAHLETDVSEEYFRKVNVENTQAFVERCHQAGLRRFVHCSSVGVFGDIQNLPADESSECHPDVAYERTKLAGEQAITDYARRFSYDLVAIRPAWVYGPRDPRTERLFRTIKKGRFFFVGDGRKLRHPIYISDMVEGFEIAAQHKTEPGEVFIMAGPRAVTLVELVEWIAKYVGVKPPALRLPQSLVYTGCLIMETGARLTGMKAPFTRRSMKFYTGNSAFRIDKAKQSLGFVPHVDLAEGLELTYRWLLQEARI